MPPPDELVPVLALLVLLATAYRHPSGRVEAVIGVVAAGATLATGALGLTEVVATLRDLGPVVVFLATILVVADVCARAGVFVAAAHLVRMVSRGEPVRLGSEVLRTSTAGVAAVAALLARTPRWT